ncbi:MAG: SDR family NAD(P)-dependent oxidoreductase [Pseudomonadota bacterium]|nr:SDR family NAD(P)-dependent oxidoreductase [Pseudomonadota bacterium]
MGAPLAIITGATGGLGSELSKRFWTDNYSVILVGRDKKKLGRLRESLPARRGQYCEIFLCDFSDLENVKRFCQAAINPLRYVHVLINNAAIQGPVGRSWEIDTTDWMKIINVNFLAPIEITSHVVRKMKQAGYGSVVNLSGGGATSPRPNFNCYGSLKAALVRFSETLAEELRSTGITVNCVAPGVMPTALLKEVVSAGVTRTGSKEQTIAGEVFDKNDFSFSAAVDLIMFLTGKEGRTITGKLVSAVWDNWKAWPVSATPLLESDVYTLRRIRGADRGFDKYDK